MAFYAVVRDREDGDFDSVAAFQYEDETLDTPAAEGALMVYDWLVARAEGEDQYRIIRIQNVDDVISQEVFGDEVPDDIAEELRDKIA